MKSLMPWVCLVASTSMQVAFAAEGIDTYRLGDYNAAANQFFQSKNTDPVSEYYMGRMRLYGYGELKNDLQALRHFEKAAEGGFLPAQNFMARYALLQQNNPKDALNWFKKAADANDAKAQLYCAAAYLFGYGTNKNSGQARRYYIAAAKNGDPIAQYTLAEHFLDSRHRSNHKLGLIWLEKSVAQGNPLAQLKLGMMYDKGKQVKQNKDKALELMHLAVAQNHWPAALALGQLAESEKEYKEAEKWYVQAASNQFPPAQFALAQLYLDKDAPLYDGHQGYLWMLKAAQNHYQKAELALAKLYDEGKVVDKNEKLAKQWQKLAEKKKKNQDLRQEVASWLTNGNKTNLAESRYQLHGILSPWRNPNALQENNYNPSPQMEQVGRDLLYKPDFSMADPKQIAISDYYDALATSLGDASHHSAELHRYDFDSNSLVFATRPLLPKSFSITYLEDNPLYPQVGDSRFDVSAFLLSQKESDNNQTLYKDIFAKAVLGNAEAQFRLAQMYEQGIEVEKNIDEAMKFYFLAAEQEDMRAEYNLGLLFLEGKDIDADHKVALNFLKDAAFKGNDHAQFALAELYEKGYRNAEGTEVISPDHQRAVDMYYLAAANDYGPAQYRLAELMVREKPDNISVAAKKDRHLLIKQLYQGAKQDGVKEAELPLAFFKAMEQDKAKQAEAFAAAKQEADKGNRHAALLLGLMYDRGIAVERNSGEALFWYQKGALNPVSAFILGTYYSQGQGVTQDEAKGKVLLQKAADASFSYANLNLAVLNKKQNESFVDELNTARRLGNATAGLLLADYYLSAAGDDEQMRQARDIYQYFAEKGDKNAQLKLAFMYEEGLGGNTDGKHAEAWYLKAAEQNQPLAQYLLGRFYQLGKGDSRPDYAQAKQWYEKAQKNYPPASVALGFIAETVEDAYQKAKTDYQQGVKQKNALAAYNLGLIYELGKHHAVDFEKAKEVYDQAASQGHTQAMVQLAGLYLNGEADGRDEQKALHWYKKAADTGNRDALYQLGLLSETGVATKLNFKEAQAYYQQAAKRGHAKAMLALARMYQYGLGVHKDTERAKTMYETLAARDNPYAQYQLATFYFADNTSDQDLEKARKLLVAAQKNGSLQAKRKLQWLDARSKEQLSYIEPAVVNQSIALADRPADLMYLDAINEWNRGDEVQSRRILNHIMVQFPQYAPAKRAYEQLYPQVKSGIVS